MGVQAWLYLIGGGGLVAAVVFVLYKFKEWGATEERAAGLAEKKKGLETDVQTAQKQRDVAARPTGSVDDTVDFLSGRVRGGKVRK